MKRTRQGSKSKKSKKTKEVKQGGMSTQPIPVIDKELLDTRVIGGKEGNSE